MSIDPFIRQNLAFDNITSPFQDSFRTAYSFRRINDPASTIDFKGKNNSIPTYSYPLDNTRYQFVAIECSWEGSTAGPGTPFTNPKLSFEKIYKLPLPNPLNDGYQINYDGNENWLNLLTGAADLFSQFTGLTPNQLKSVTLKSPQYRVHNHVWKLSPKSYDESVIIKDIIFNLKKGMHPHLFPGIAGTKQLQFPKIYLPFFVPNMRYLYKFKPCVIQALSVDYQGGNKVPSFYRSENQSSANSELGLFPTANTTGESISYTAQESPPESVELRVQWLELEYWISGVNGDDTKGDFKDTYNPFDAYNWFDGSGRGSYSTNTPEANT